MYFSDATAGGRQNPATEIGADPGTNGATAVEVTYYSIYQHLRKLDAALPALNQPIYRKDKLGLAGDIHGQPNRIHLEIIAGDADTQKLVGRKTAELPLNKDGRSNTVYGQLYVLLPAKSACHATQPGNAPLPAPSGDSGNTDQIIGIQYDQGHATLTTYQLTGEIVGSAPVETDAEYQLYAEANKRHAALSPNERANSSPSGWYELLRFGRNLGPDPLPAHAAHWRKVVLPDHSQGAWVNLNAAGTYKFSDADFPHWMGWKLIDDDTEDNNSQCNSALIDAMLSPAAQPKAAPAGPPSLIAPSTPPPQAPETAQTTPEQRAANRLQNLCKPAVQEKLAKTICKFPTEWTKNELRSRWAWIKAKGNPYMPFPLDDEEFEKVVTFGEKLCFWEELPQEDKDRLTFTHWHFHPREFIAHFRKCGWLSLKEIALTIPKYPFYTDSGKRKPIKSPKAFVVSYEQAISRMGTHYIHLNQVMSKYSIITALRQVHFLAQVILETAQWRNSPPNRIIMHEWFFGKYSSANPATQYYSAFYGRGIMQLTWAGNYKKYGEYRSNIGLPDNSGEYKERLTPDSPRITKTSLHYSAHPNDGGTQFKWSPRYDPDIIGSDPYNACDSGGFYWVSKNHSRAININRVCDETFSSISVGKINRLVNGGGNGYHERQAYAAYIMRILGDIIDSRNEVEITTPKSNVLVNFLRPVDDA